MGYLYWGLSGLMCFMALIQNGELIEWLWIEIINLNIINQSDEII